MNYGKILIDGAKKTRMSSSGDLKLKYAGKKGISATHMPRQFFPTMSANNLIESLSKASVIQLILRQMTS